jgi:hypothetical protein
MSAPERRSFRPYPRFLYRCFDEEGHARRLLEGYVWISTFGFLRETERARGDRAEASLEYRPGVVDSDDKSEAMQEKMANLERSGFVMEPGFAVKIYPADDSKLVVNVRPDDGYLLCMTGTSPTAVMRSAFGDFCVRIASPAHFVQLVSDKMASYAEQWEAGFLDYSGRHYRGIERLPLSAPFVGPAGNAHEAEFRIHWSPRLGRDIRPFEIHVPEIANLCSMT